MVLIEFQYQGVTYVVPPALFRQTINKFELRDYDKLWLYSYAWIVVDADGMVVKNRHGPSGMSYDSLLSPARRI